MLVGYARVSSIGQNLTSQIEALAEFRDSWFSDF
jgi:DNA invertase Pin-like site-specific DNA recombinase